MLINAGQRVTADLLNELVPLNSIKAGDQHYTNQTLTNDNDLFLAVNANTSYLFQATFFYEGNVNGSSDMKFQWTVPSGSTMSICVPAYFFTDGVTHGPSYITASQVLIVGTNGAGSIRAVSMTGSLVTGNNSGNLQLQAARNSSASVDTIIHAQSFVALQEVG